MNQSSSIAEPANNIVAVINAKPIVIGIKVKVSTPNPIKNAPKIPNVIL